MKSAVPFLAISILMAVFSAALLGAGSPPAWHVESDYSTGASVPGNTSLGDNSGCAPCHGSPSDGNTTVAITGPNMLYAGQTGQYTVTTTRTGANGYKVGVDIASSDAGALSLVAGEPMILSSGDIVHSKNAGTLRVTSNGVASYLFKYTMPGSAALASTHTLAAVSAVSLLTGGWSHAPNFTVTTTRPPTPATIATGTIGANSIDLTWSGTGPHFRVIRKNGINATFSGPTDGVLVYEGSNTSATASGLTPLTSYTFAVFGKVASQSVYSSASVSTNGTTGSSTPTNVLYVNVTTGNDLNPGTSGSPLKTIKKALGLALPGDTINVASGTYNLASGETFPIVMKNGLKLIGAGAATTIIDAADANARVVTSSGNNAETLLQGFTIRRGVHASSAPDGAEGGGIFSANGDQMTIARNIITENEALGYSGSLETGISGGYAYGGGIYILYSTTTVVNNLFLANTAIGGTGLSITQPGSGFAEGGTGGNGYGGGVYAFQSPAAVIANNTFVGNRATGGNGGSHSQGGAGGDGGSAQSGGAGGTATFFNNLFSANEAIGGTGGSGAPNAVNGSATYGGEGATPSGDYDLFYANVPDNGSVGANSVTGDPKFIHAPSLDYRIAKTSPGAGAGTPNGAPPTDLTGLSRANPPSIGAYEAVKANTSTTLTALPNPSAMSQQVTLTATVTSTLAGSLTGTVTFKNGGTTIGSATLSGGSASMATTSLPEGSHPLTAIYGGDANYNGSTSNVVNHVVNPLTAPTNFTATATGASQVMLTWSPVAGATSYEILRGSVGSLTPLTTTADTAHSDVSVAAGTAYLYKVRAIGSGTPSPYATDAATTVVLSDDLHTSGEIIKAIHIAELRAALNALRVMAGLTAISYTDPTLEAGDPIRAAHITELRSGLAAVRTASGLPQLNYTDPTVTAEATTAKRAHILELRNGVM